MVATLGESTGRVFLGRMRDQMLESSTGRRILRERPSINTKTIDFDELKRTCGPGTFGDTYVKWLEAEGVTPDTRCPVC
jgi:ubiquinone biosynthesis protein COQ4